MSGPTLTMSTVTTKEPAFHRSHSSPTLPDLVNFDFIVHPVQNVELPRSASFHTLPSLEAQTISEKDTIIAAEIPAENVPSPQKQDVGEEKKRTLLTTEERPKLERVGRRKALVARPKSWIAKVRSSPERQKSSESIVTTPSDAPPVPAISRAIREKDSKTKTVSESFATFARKSWADISRSPSPGRRVGLRDTESEGKSAADSKMTGSPLTSSRPVNPPPPKFEIPRPPSATGSPPKSRSSTTFQRIKQRPASVLMNFTNFNSTNSSASSLPRSSLDNRSTPRTSTDRVPVITKESLTDKLHLHSEPARRRDELWSAFRSLENDYSKFQSKSWSLKTNVVRASLLPFLKNHASHPSNRNLRPEDLDRRVTILNKWWTGLLEVLDGRQNQTVSGVDRPVLLEACYAIMTRPEWRLSPSHFAPLSERSASQSPERRPTLSRKRSSAASLKSSASQFMTESVYHNTRNLFIQNLLSQISFVVDKMSLRHAPASLVTFCGKAAAYAFFFVPGVADVLVRIWKLEADVLRRVSDALGMPRRVNKMELDNVNCAFPNHIQGLGWTSVKTMATLLRQIPTLPVLAAKIPWNGPWAARWCGRDSDLFYVFAKHYHVLAEEFMPEGLSLAQKARAPGFVLVQAQILSALDATIHRQPAGDPLPITFDDVLAGADASAAALPLPSTNSTRLMAENRLIMLLRDFISERPSDYDVARKTFAESFGKIMQASAGRTSLFDHNACFVLLDFAEEALAIYVRFHFAHALDWDYIDWPFWLNVCKKMLESENSMSEIRLFSFLYGSWHLITHDEQRKEILCLNWLLSEETFDKFFNHWCPMVRAYYMRLICWRLCRDDGEASDLDTKIFSTVSMRLKANWAHYLFLKQAADKAGILPPSTAPCHPAPGRRLLIIRNDSQLPAASMFLGFDGIVNPSSSQGLSNLPQPSKRQSLPPLPATDAENTPKLPTDTPTPSSTPNKKRWSSVLMGKMLPSALTPAESAPQPSSLDSQTQSQATTPTSSPPKQTQTLESARLQTALSRTTRRPTLHAKSSSTDSETPPATSTHRVFSFKFSLEWTQHFEKPAGLANNASINGNGGGSGNGNGNGMAAGSGGVNGNAKGPGSPERRVIPPRLPAPAQAWIGARIPGMSAEISPRDPKLDGGELVRKRAKYAGRALAEWAMIVGECNNFVERRRGEGVPGLRWVEVPTLGVEGFRRFG